ncbi:MAG TPA: ABC transporter permease [bacterium]|nr:ABC transporter permease [bacterium]
MSRANRRRFIWTLSYLVGIAVLGVVAPRISPYDPLLLNPDHVLAPPSAAHWLGTDEFGRDILSRLLYGIRPSLTIAVASTLLASAPGLYFGVLAGYYRGAVEQLIMRTADTILCFPPIILALAVVGFLGPSIPNLVLVIGLLYIPTFVRLAYASTLDVTQIEYITVARAIGVPHSRVIARHVVPNIMSPILVQCGVTVAAAILLESGLSFLGLGVQPPSPSWGQMIGAAKAYLAESGTYVLWPSIAIAMTILVLNQLTDTLRDHLDPRTRRGGQLTRPSKEPANGGRNP